MATLGARRGFLRRIEVYLPHGWRDFWVQFFIFWTFYAGYELSHAFAQGAAAEADVNGQRVMSAERALGFFWERGIQHWAENAPGIVMEIAKWTYFNCQFSISFAFMLWVYFRRNHAFYFVRNTILFADFIGLIGYITFPTKPPRMYTHLFNDSLNSTAINHKSGIIETFSNPYAAMPSLHTAYATTIGVTGVLVCRSLIGKLVWAAYPSLVVFSIVATANHFLLDALAGAFVAMFAATLALSVTRGVTPRVGREPKGFLVPRGPALEPAAAGD